MAECGYVKKRKAAQLDFKPSKPNLEESPRNSVTVGYAFQYITKNKLK